MIYRGLFWCLVGLAGAFCVATPAAAAAPSCTPPLEPGQVVRQVPAEQLAMAPQRIWPTTTGAGVTVAVLDTGVDDDHPQLRDAVATGWDLVDDAPGGTVDCAGRGTAVASIIAARQVSGVGFAGIAPGVRILPVRVAEQATGPDNRVEPAALAFAIRWAADQGADVINVSLTSTRDTAGLRDAVRHAGTRDAVVVATTGTRDASAPARADPPVFPAAYPGVLGVGAVGRDGVRLANSPVGSFVDIVALGGEVLGAVPTRGHTTWSGSDFATPVVSAAAALVRAAHPDLNANEVARRLVATADQVPDAVGSANIRPAVDPYGSVTEMLTEGEVAELPAAPPPTVDAEAERREAYWRSLARGAGATALVIVVLVFALAVAVWCYRYRRHTPTPAPPPGNLDDLDDSIDACFAVPKPPRPE